MQGKIVIFIACIWICSRRDQKGHYFVSPGTISNAFDGVVKGGVTIFICCINSRALLDEQFCNAGGTNIGCPVERSISMLIGRVHVGALFYQDGANFRPGANGCLVKQGGPNGGVVFANRVAVYFRT